MATLLLKLHTLQHGSFHNVLLINCFLILNFLPARKQSELDSLHGAFEAYKVAVHCIFDFVLFHLGLKEKDFVGVRSFVLYFLS